MNQSSDKTIHNLARRYRQELMDEYGKALYARLVLYLHDYCKIEGEIIFDVLETSPIDSLEYKLAVCLLDGYGYGDAYTGNG